MHLIERVCLFDEALCWDHFSLFEPFNLCLLDWLAILCKNDGGRAEVFGTRHLLALSKREQCVGVVMFP